jgi:hypothetical protein
MGKKSGSGSGSGSGMINPYHIFESLETIFFHPEWKKIGYGIREGKNSDPGSRINIPDPQHCPKVFQVVFGL